MKSTKPSTLKTSNQVATVVFVDAGVENYQQLVNGVIPTAEVFVLDAAAEGIKQISQVLQQRQDVGAVHIVSHGAPGQIFVGRAGIALDALTESNVGQWRQSLSAEAEILLYGCNVAAGEQGRQFVERLAHLTDAAVYASNTVVGSFERGGTWKLRKAGNDQELHPVDVFTPATIASYSGVFVTINPTGGTNSTDGLQIQVETDGDFFITKNGGQQVYALDSSDTVLAVGTTTYGSDNGYNANWVSLGQSAVTGAGTSSNPYRVVTSLLADVNSNGTYEPTIDFKLDWTVSYTAFNNFYAQNFTLVAPAGNTQTVKLTQAFDSFLGGSDSGPAYGLDASGTVISGTSGNPKFIGVSQNLGQPNEIVMGYIENNAEFSQWYSGYYSTPYGQINNGGNLTTTYNTNASTDNGIAVQYDLGALTGTRSISNFLAFSTDAINNLIDAGLVVSESDITVGEDGTTATFTVGLQAAPTSNVVLDLSSSDTTEAILSTNSLTFTPTNWNTPQTVTVSASNDGIADGDQTSVITIRVNDASSDNNFDGLSKTINVTTTDLLNEEPNPAPTQSTNWNFLTRDYNGDGATDIVAIKQSDTGTGTTEVHIMDGATNYQSWLLQTGTALGETDDTWDFVKGDCNRDGATDILSIHKSGTATGTTEVHILDAATNYQSFVLHTDTALGTTGDNFDFQAADYNRDGITDIIAIQKSGTGSGRTEIHILDGATNYKSWLLNTATVLAPTDNTWKFQVGDYNGDGVTDIVGLKQSDTGTATTEVHVLNGATNYQSFVMQTGTALTQTGNNWDFLMDDYNRNNSTGIIGLKESDTGTGTTEAHILNAGTIYQSFALQTGSVLPPVAPSELV